MTITLHLPADVESAYLAQAQARGVPLTDVVSEVLIASKPAVPAVRSVHEQGAGLFGSPEDAKLLDEVVTLAYEERRRPSKPSDSL